MSELPIFILDDAFVSLFRFYFRIGENSLLLNLPGELESSSFLIPRKLYVVDLGVPSVSFGLK
jgi:hypothetical protein